MKHLVLSENPVISLNEKLIWNLPNLNTLILENCALIVLHDEFFDNCSKLQKLVLSYNNLETLPNSISKLHELRELLLNNNKLKLIDSIDFNNHTNLETLDLQNNDLEYLPSKLVSKFTGKILRLQGNPKLEELAINTESKAQISKLILQYYQKYDLERYSQMKDDIETKRQETKISEFYQMYRSSNLISILGQIFLTPILIFMLYFDFFISSSFLIDLIRSGNSTDFWEVVRLSYWYIVSGIAGVFFLIIYYAGGVTTQFNKYILLVATINLILNFALCFLTILFMIFLPFSVSMWLILNFTTSFEIENVAPDQPNIKMNKRNDLTLVLLTIYLLFTLYIVLTFLHL